MRKSPFRENDIIEFSTLKSRCVYLEDQNMTMQYKYINNCTESLNADLVKRGWRRFGKYFSRPNCESCNACESLRIDVKNFTFSKSQRRLLKKNQDTGILVRKPWVTQDHLRLYEKYHRFMETKKGWDYFEINADSYHDLYIKGFSTFGNEILYYRDHKLIGVDLIDYMDDGISSIYFYYDPDYREFSLGTYSLLKQIEFAKKRELDWIYLGYYVKECESLNYKERYKPYQILQNLPDLNEKFIWK